MEVEKEDSIKLLVELHRPHGGADLKLPWPNDHALASYFKKDAGGWDKSRYKQCYQRQLKYVVPKFSEGQEYHIAADSKLPFLRNESFGDQDTNDSRLFEVEFDGRYLLPYEEQPLTSTGIIKMMRKELHLEDKEKEKVVLQVLHSWQKTQSPHIVHVYAYYKQDEKWNILMPLLQGDVRGLLGKNEQCDYFETDDRYYAQMRNLAKAVASLHSILTPSGFNITGIHHDLKPANVLLHEGNFILADFGIGTLLRPSAGEEQDSHGNLSWWTAPEEYADDVWPGTASPKTDMFHLGCIFMDLLVHMRGKAQSVKAFRERRNPKKPYAAPFCKDKKLNPQVSLQLEEIRQEPGSDKRRQLADVICRLLAHEPRNRPTAQELVDSMNCIIGEDMAESTSTGSGTRRQTLNVPLPSFPLNPQDDQIGKEMASLTFSSAQRPDAGLPSGPSKDMTDTRPGKNLTVAEAISSLGGHCKHETDVPPFLQIQNLRTKQQGQIKCTWEQPYFRKWTSKSASDVLFLYNDYSNDEKVLLYIAAKVIRDAEVAEQPPKKIILSHFCTENKKDAEHSVLNMVQSLLGQLLHHRNNSESSDIPRRALAKPNLESIRELFREFIESLDKEMLVVCVIDGLHAYCNRFPGDARKREAEETISLLIRLASTTQCRFKLLLTASSKPIADRFSRDCGILVHSVCHNVSDQQGLSPRFFERKALKWT